LGDGNFTRLDTFDHQFPPHSGFTTFTYYLERYKRIPPPSLDIDTGPTGSTGNGINSVKLQWTPGLR